MRKNVEIVLGVIALVLFFVVGCGPKPDANSGGDAERYQAKKIDLGQPVADEVDYNGGDRTDWKVLFVEDPGVLKIEVVVDNENAGLVVELYDKYGRRLGRAVHVKDVGPKVDLLQEVTPGKYFIKVYAKSKGDKTGYTLIPSIIIK